MNDFDDKFVTRVSALPQTYHSKSKVSLFNEFIEPRINDTTVKHFSNSSIVMYPRLFCSKRFTRPEARAKRSLFAHLMVDKDKEKFGWTISERLLLSAAVNAHQTNWFVVSRALRNHDLTKARLADENFFSAEVRSRRSFI